LITGRKKEPLLHFTFCMFILPAAYLSQYKLAKESGGSKLCSLVLDTGYSFSHIVPYCKGEKMKESIVR